MSTMDRKKSLTILVIFSAAAGIFALRNATLPALEADEAARSTTTATAVPPTSSPTYESCAYMWAYHDAPGELTEKLSSVIQAIDPQATSRASLFGEDCIYGDGHVMFTTMETDFYIRMEVDDLSDEEKLGSRIKLVMNLIDQIPREDIPGNDGFVEFQFVAGSSESLIVRVSVRQYRDEGQGKSGAELFRMFLIPAVLPAPT